MSTLETEEPSSSDPMIRGRARLHRSVAAFMRRGFDSSLSQSLVERGLTLGAAQQLTDGEMQALRFDITARHIQLLNQY